MSNIMNKNKNSRKVDFSDKTGRKYIYHSQIKTNDLRFDDRLIDVKHKNVSKKISLLRQAPTILSFIVIISTVLYISTLNSSPQIITVNNSKTIKFLHSNDEYQQTIKAILSRSIMNKSKFTIDSNSVARQFKNYFPELNSATIIIPLTGHRLQIILKASTPVVSMQNSNGYYLLNDEGTIIYKYNTLSEMISTKLLVLTDQSNSRVQISKNFVSVKTMIFIQNIIYQYSKKGIIIQNLTLPISPYELDVQNRGENYMVKYNLLDEPKYEIGTYFSTIKYIQTNNLAKPNQYIDLRVSEKSFYK